MIKYVVTPYSANICTESTSKLRVCVLFIAHTHRGGIYTRALVSDNWVDTRINIYANVPRGSYSLGTILPASNLLKLFVFICLSELTQMENASDK